MTKHLFGNSKSVFGYLSSIAGVGGVTLFLSPFRAHVNSTTVALALLLAVLLTATIFGSRPALLAALLGVLSLNFFFLEPLYTFTISDSQNWIAFGAFLVTAIIAGQLSSYARRRAEEAETNRRESERLYKELQAAFEQASEAEALRRSEQLKSSLLDAVTHDLRTPLTSIKASVTTLIEDAETRRADGKAISTEMQTLTIDDETRAEFLEIINEETDRLNQFIESLVGIAKVEAGALALRKAESRVEEIVRAALDRAKNRLSAHDVSVEIEDNLPSVTVDANSIAEVVYTLLDNAAKYSPAASSIKIQARLAANETIEISVEDEGRGVAAEKREKIFDKFYRASETDLHTTASGLGLGLAIARGIVESQGGRIWLEDGRGDFTTRAAFQILIGEK